MGRQPPESASSKGGVEKACFRANATQIEGFQPHFRDIHWFKDVRAKGADKPDEASSMIVDWGTS